MAVVIASWLRVLAVLFSSTRRLGLSRIADRFNGTRSDYRNRIVASSEQSHNFSALTPFLFLLLFTLNWMHSLDYLLSIGFVSIRWNMRKRVGRIQLMEMSIVSCN